MKLSELYHEKVVLLTEHSVAADASDDADKRMCLNMAARHFQHEADYIAHCLAYFGDQDISNLLGDDVLKRAQAMPCKRENPWSRGLDLLRQTFPA